MAKAERAEKRKVSVPRGTWETWRRAAAREERSLSALIRRAMAEYLEGRRRKP
jgi:hypothetical protein